MGNKISKSDVRESDSKMYKGGFREKERIARDMRSNMSEDKMGEFLKQKYGYEGDKKKRIIKSFKKDGPQEMTQAQKMRQRQKERKLKKEEERKIKRKELAKQRKVEAEEEERRAKRAKASGLMARRMEDDPSKNRMNFVGSQNKKKGIGGDKPKSRGGFASQPSKGGTSSANQGKSSGFASGGASEGRDNFFRK